jgi:hypothetical protein
VVAVPSIDASSESAQLPRRFTILSPNPGKRVAEIWYLVWFLMTLPYQAWVSSGLSYTQSNDPSLITQGMVMGIGAWAGATFIRAKEDRNKPFYEVYGFKLGVFLFCWAMIGGYLGTDPWYEVLHGHFAFNTDINPNGVPFFMLPMTIAVFGLYCTILGVIFRVVWFGWKTLSAPIPDWIAKLAIFLPLAALMPLLETYAATSPNYCFDNAVGQWFLNVFVYGSWHFSALWFFTQFDEQAGENQPVLGYWIRGLAVVALTLFLMQLITDYMAPNFTEVTRGVRYVNDWSPDNCLGPKPTS